MLPKPQSGQLAEQQTALTKLNLHIREVAIYTSDHTSPLRQEQGLATDPSLSQEEFSLSPGPGGRPEPALPQIEFEGFGFGI